MLFWAAFFKEIEQSTVEAILADLEAYPEAPMALKQNQTALHAVTATPQSGHKITALFDDLHKRKLIRSQNKTSSLKGFDDHFKGIIEIYRLSEMRANVDKFNKRRAQNFELPDFDF